MGNRDKLAVVQGAYYAATGIWPIVSIDSFQRVTGPKRDLWLVKTVGAMIAVCGGVMMMGGLRRSTTPEIMALATGSAAALTAVDINYSVRGVISKIYLADAVVEIGLIGLWAGTAEPANQSDAVYPA